MSHALAAVRTDVFPASGNRGRGPLGTVLRTRAEGRRRAPSIRIAAHGPDLAC
ncbi:hypothetical protein SUDANB70_00122 [Streptomyces sp. enrichment culture]